MLWYLQLSESCAQTTLSWFPPWAQTHQDKKNVIYNRSKIIWSKHNPDYFTTKRRFAPTLWHLGDTPGSRCWLSQGGRAVTACGSVPPLPARPRRWGLHSGTGPTLQLHRRPRRPIKSIDSTVESYNKILLKWPLTFFQSRCRFTFRGHSYTWKNSHNTELQHIPTDTQPDRLVSTWSAPVDLRRGGDLSL